MAQMVLYSPSFCTSRKVGMVPPLKNMVKAKNMEMVFRKGISGRDRGYAVRIVRITLISVPKAV